MVDWLFGIGFTVFVIGGAVNIPGHEFLILIIGTALMIAAAILKKGLEK